MERFGIDYYLLSLGKNIKNNDIIQSIDIKNKACNVKKSYLRNELEFFDYLNLKLNDVYAKYRGKICYTNPKNIKIILGDKMDDMISSHVFRTPYSYSVSKEDLELINWYIFINNSYYYSMEASYLHEITHTQTTEGRNMNYINKEVLSLFIEFLYGNYNDKSQILFKLYMFPNSIDLYMNTKSEFDRLNASSYIVSTMEAINLYDTYMKSNKKIKKEILQDIQRIFDYNITLEEILSKYNIDYDSFKPDIKRLIRIAN